MRSRDDIKEFIVTEFVPGGVAADIGDDLDLINSGVIDSLGVLNLISALESETGLRIEPEEMDSANFASVAKIHAFIEAKSGV
ncbi:acyl carrier protein [Paracoccus sp. (in: a-proteobacteria)]|uniref:acyl carrier protein n=1 Tax=Paracoccus sp. TaxID=267 RepID=UPI003A8B9FF7